MSTPTPPTPALQGFYLSFSGESSAPINNVYALSTSGAQVSTTVLDTSRTYQELRGMAFGPDGCLYVCQAYKGASMVLQFTAPTSGNTWTFEQAYALPSASPGLLHPYDLAFGPDGNLYVSSQDTNVVTGFYGPESTGPGTAMPSSTSLPSVTPPPPYYAGTMVAAWKAGTGVPPFPPVPVAQGGLSFTTTSSGSTHSVRGVAFDSAGYLYAADEGNNRVVVLGPISSGKLPYVGAITSSKNHSLQEPVALWFDAGSGLLYIGSPGNQRIFTYAVSGVGSGNFEANALMQDSVRLDKVSGIAVASGSLYTCSREKTGGSKDNPTYSVYQWSTSGALVGTFASGFTDTPEQIVPVYSGFGSSPAA
jgi:hypothetical protein